MGIMKRILLFTLLCVTFPFLGYSQFGDESPIPYFRYSVTAGLGANVMYSDLAKQQVGGSVYARGNYFVTHGLSIGLELQEGLLRGTDSVQTDGVVRSSVNFYHSATIGVRFQPIKYLQDDHLRRIEYRESFGKRTLNSVYVGAGVGALYSLQWDKERVTGSVPGTDPVTGNPITVIGVLPEYQGRDHGFSYIFSTDLGFEIPLHSLKPNLLDSYVWNLVVNGQLNFSLDDELDGYSGDYSGNDSKDVYGLLSVGVNLRF